MTADIKKIFHKDIELLGFTDKTITYLRKQNYNKALFFSTCTINTITLLIDDIVRNQAYFNEVSILVNIDAINEMLVGLLDAQKNKDYILLADLYEMQWIPFILGLQSIIINKERYVFEKDQYENNIKLLTKKNVGLGKLLLKLKTPLEGLEEGYLLEYTASGLLTLALIDNNEKYYLHSNGQIIHEAGILAREWFRNENSEYIIYGLGLGYHIMELMELDDSISIKVYESDINVIQAACVSTDLSNVLLDDRINIIYDPEFKQLSAAMGNIKKDASFVIHYPSLRNIKNIIIKEQLEDYFITYSSVNNQLHKLTNNFKRNILLQDKCVDVLKRQFTGKSLYIIAAGPSLDKNYLKLKNIRNDSIILATGTVFKKLLHAGIKPDYVIIIDANEPVYRQIEGVETADVPLLYLSTVYYKIVQNYQGEKYIIYQKDFLQSEKIAKQMGHQLYQTGGSVSTTALDIGISFGCKRIIYLGLDLAYTNSYDHASGTASVNRILSNDLRQVKDIHGNLIQTSKNLDIYRKWIENRVIGINEIELIDATEGGAKINGFNIVKLNEVI